MVTTTVRYCICFSPLPPPFLFWDLTHQPSCFNPLILIWVFAPVFATTNIFGQHDSLPSTAQELRWRCVSSKLVVWNRLSHLIIGQALVREGKDQNHRAGSCSLSRPCQWESLVPSSFVFFPPVSAPNTVFPLYLFLSLTRPHMHTNNIYRQTLTRCSSFPSEQTAPTYCFFKI